MGQKRGVQNFERVTFLVLWLSYKWQENISFSSLKMIVPWGVSLQELFLIGNMTHFEGIANKLQKSA